MSALFDAVLDFVGYAGLLDVDWLQPSLAMFGGFVHFVAWCISSLLRVVAAAERDRVWMLRAFPRLVHLVRVTFISASVSK